MGDAANHEAGEQITNVASGFSGCAGSEEAQQRLNVVVLNNLQESWPTLCLPRKEAGSGRLSLFFPTSSDGNVQYCPNSHGQVFWVSPTHCVIKKP